MKIFKSLLLVGIALIAGSVRADDALVDPIAEAVYQKDSDHVIQKGGHDAVQKGRPVQKSGCLQKGGLGHVQKGGHVQKLGHKLAAVKHGLVDALSHHHAGKGDVVQKGGVHQKGGHVQKGGAIQK